MAGRLPLFLDSWMRLKAHHMGGESQGEEAFYSTFHEAGKGKDQRRILANFWRQSLR